MRWAVGGFCGYGGSVWVMDEWSVVQWIVDVMSFQKIYGLYGLKNHTVDLLSCIVDPDFKRPRTDGQWYSKRSSRT